MKTVLALLSAFAVTCVLTMPAAAQYVTQGELNHFNSFLNSHPGVAQQLHRNPNLVNNSNYLEQHPELHTYLADHDQIRRAIQTHPGKFAYSGGRYSYGWERRAPYSRMVTPQQWNESHNYGYYDPSNHQWHDREWWEQNRADWVRTHHPNWAAANAEHRQDYNKWRAEHHDEDANEHHDNGKHKGWNQGHGNDHGKGHGQGHDNH
jgi:hypothetical protein